MTASIASLGIDPERLARIPAFIKERYLDTGCYAGAQFSVLRRGQLVHQSTQGLADRERGTPLREDAIFRIFSMTKPITAIAFMMLVEEGKIALDDLVHRHIPFWKNLRIYESGEAGNFKTRPNDKPMRIVDLLRHTSGLTYDLHGTTGVPGAYGAVKLGWAHGQHDMDGFIQALSELPLVAEPESVWNYSVSTDVLGYLVEKVSGMPFADFLQTRIFDPLGMVDTAFFVAPENSHRLAALYCINPKGETVLLDDPQTSAYLKPPHFASGGGGLTSTSADYLRFVRMLLGRGSLDGVRLISPKTLDLMTVNHIPGGRDLTQASVSLFSEAVYEGVGFGLGFAVTFDQPKTLIPGTSGDFFWGGWASTFFFVDPVEDLAVVFMTQLGPSSSYPNRRQIRTLVYSALTETA